MTAREWLVANDKKPYRPDEDGGWYWGSEGDSVPDAPESDDMLLPDAVFDRMCGQRTYPNLRRYPTEEAAINDFEQAFQQSEAVD